MLRSNNASGSGGAVLYDGDDDPSVGGITVNATDFDENLAQGLGGGIRGLGVAQVCSLIERRDLWGALKCGWTSIVPPSVRQTCVWGCCASIGCIGNVWRVWLCVVWVSVLSEAAQCVGMSALYSLRHTCASAPLSFADAFECFLAIYLFHLAPPYPLAKGGHYR